MNKSFKPYWDRALKCYELKELERLGLTPDMDQRQKILTFIGLLLKWNPVAGLISPKDEAALFIRHFCDSLQPLLLFGFKKGARVLDIGSGGGFPAIPIQIFRPDLSVILAEANRKKGSFLKEVKAELVLEGLELFCGRSEKLVQAGETFDYVLSRGVTSLTKFARMAKPLVTPEGRMYTFKTKRFSAELEEITVNKEAEGVRISEIAEYDLGTLIKGLNLVSLAKL